ncbi:MAG: hypothetical protein GY757_26735 [bacterium]|nr:hypothetical protein [bacterium]
MKENSENQVPYFCWDRNLTEKEIKHRLKNSSGVEKDRLIAWLLREAAFRDVWTYTTPREVAECLPRIQHSLGRWKDFWNYITGAWHELGKI